MEASPARSQISVKTALVVSLTALGVTALAYLIVETRAVILMTVAAALIATALHHAVDFLMRHHFRRSLALVTTIAATLAVISGVLLLIVPPAVAQAGALANEIPKIAREVQHSDAYRFVQARLGASGGFGSASSALSEGAGSAVHAVVGLLGGLATVASTFFLVLFMLIFARRLFRAWLDETLPDRRELYERVTHKIYMSVGGYLAGLTFICSVNATLTTTFLAIARVPYFLPLGLVSGLSSLVPYAGPITAGATITLIALATKGLWTAVAALVYFLLYGQLEGQILGPVVFRRTVDMDPLVTVLAILFLAELAGVVGAIIAVPAAAAGQIILREMLAIRRERLGIQ